MLTIVGGTGAKCTVGGTAVPILMLKLTFCTRGALLLTTVLRISVFCCVVRLTVAFAEAELDEEALAAGVRDEPDAPFCVAPWVALPCDPVLDCALVPPEEVAVLALPVLPVCAEPVG